MHDDLPYDIGPENSFMSFTARELELLRRACAAADREAKLQAVIDEKGYMLKGSTGQDVLNQAVGELRQVESQIARLVSQIDTGSEGTAPTMKQQRAEKAANGRWLDHCRREAERREVAGA